MKKFLVLLSLVLFASTLLASCGVSKIENPLKLDFILLTDDTYGVCCDSDKKHEKIIVPATYNGVAVTKVHKFADMTELQKVELPSSITVIDLNAFQNCEKLETINLPSGITEIGASAFSGCVSIERITLPSGITAISDFTFNGCRALLSIEIPDGVTVIGDTAFSGCTSLERITIPKTVTQIGKSTFYASNPVIYFEGSEDEWNAITKADSWSGDKNMSVIFNA